MGARIISSKTRALSPWPLIEEYSRLAEAAKLIKGKMIITINKVPEMKRVFKGFGQRTATIGYSLGSKHGKTAKRQELIIKNW